MDQQLFEKMKDSMERVKETDVSGIKLEDFDERLLFLDQLDMQTHVIIQAPALSYYGYLYSQAESELKALRESYDRWFKMKKQEAGAQLQGNDPDAYKPTSDDKEGRLYANCKQEAKISGEDEVVSWKEKINKLEQYKDLVKFWFDTFSAKNYLLKVYTEIQGIEMKGVSSIKTPIEKPLSSMGKEKLLREFKR